MHMVAALHSYTHPTWLRFGVLGHWSQTYCLYIMVEADSHLKLLPTFILEIQSV